MRIIPVLIMLALSFFAKSQTLQVPFDSATKKISYTEVVKLDGVTKDQLYVKAREWFAKTFNSAQTVIQMDDKPAGKIVGKATARSTYIFLLTNFNYTLYYTISFSAKDFKYKYEITDFIVKDDNSKIVQTLDVCAVSKDCLGKKGNYREPFKSYLQYISQLGLLLSNGLKASLKSGDAGIKSKDDFR